MDRERSRGQAPGGRLEEGEKLEGWVGEGREWGTSLRSPRSCVATVHTLPTFLPTPPCLGKS